MHSSVMLKYIKVLFVFTANAAKEHMSPYFQQIVEMLKGYLTVDQADETMSLQVQSLGKQICIFCRTHNQDSWGFHHVE